MAFKVNETLVIKNIDNCVIGHDQIGLLKATVIEVDPDHTEDFTVVKTSQTSYCHVAFKEDAAWQVELICRDIDGVVFPEDVAAVHVVMRNGRPRILVVDREGVAYGFPFYDTVSLIDLASRLNHRVEHLGKDYKLANIFIAANDVEEQIAQGVCVYEGAALSQKKELNTVNLPCVLSSGARVIGAEIAGMYGIGVGTEEEGHGAFINREQAAELLESLLQFIEGGE